VTLPGVKATYTERRSSDGKHVQEARSPGETEEPPPGVSVGVPAADRQASPAKNSPPEIYSVGDIEATSQWVIEHSMNKSAAFSVYLIALRSGTKYNAPIM
jgi:hypothetical protein